jgi:ATP-dependent Clp protease ATP-binding subunit ClpC
MTSNLGSDRIMRYAQVEEWDDAAFEELKGELMAMLTTAFRPEFINRVDEIIVFEALTQSELVDITRLFVDRVQRRLRGQHIELELRDSALKHLAESGYDPQFGARPLRRAIQRELENRLSEMILDGGLEPGGRVVVDARDGRLVLEAEDAAAAEGAAPKETAATSG